MLNIYYNNKKYKVASTLNELKLSDYQKLPEPGEDKLKYFASLLHILGEVPYDIVLKMSASDVTNISNAIIVMLNDTNKPLQNIININGEKYQFEDDLSNLRFDQFIDLAEFTDKDVDIKSLLHIIAAILYHKVIGKKKEKIRLSNIFRRKYENILEPYDAKNVFKKSELFKEHLTMDVIYGMLLFFSHLKMIYLKNTLDFLKQTELQKLKTNQE